MIVRRLGKFPSWEEAVDYAVALPPQVPLVTHLATLSVAEFEKGGWLAVQWGQFGKGTELLLALLPNLYPEVREIFAFQALAPVPSEGEDHYSFVLILVYVRDGETLVEPTEPELTMAVISNLGQLTAEGPRLARCFSEIDTTHLTRYQVSQDEGQVIISAEGKPADLVETGISVRRCLIGLPGIEKISMVVERREIKAAVHNPWPAV